MDSDSGGKLLAIGRLLAAQMLILGDLAGALVVGLFEAL
jgi:hypothetical protein